MIDAQAWQIWRRAPNFGGEVFEVERYGDPSETHDVSLLTPLLLLAVLFCRGWANMCNIFAKNFVLQCVV